MTILQTPSTTNERESAGCFEVGGVPIEARGPLSEAVLEALSGDEGRLDEIPELARACAAHADAVKDDDLQLALFLMYATAYGSLAQAGADLEWDPRLLVARATLEQAFETALRESIPVPEAPEPTASALAETLFALTAPTPGPSAARHIARHADAGQIREHLVLHSIYTLREADAHSWAIPRLTGRAKAALVEIQADEYGGGREERMHQQLYAKAMRGAGLDDTYGRYLDAVPVGVLAALNAMSMFGMHRRLRGAIVGHLAAFEMTSSIPCRLIAEGMRRLGFGDDVADYYDEHVEADAVHEQIAGRDLAGGLVEAEPDLLEDILFGAAACLALEGAIGEDALRRWEAGESALRDGPLAREVTAGEGMLR